MAITEFEAETGPGDSPEDKVTLRIVPTSAVLGEAVEIAPVEESVPVLHPVEEFEDFQAQLHSLIRGGDYEHKELEELIEIKGDIHEIRAALTARYAELARLEAVLQKEMTWTNGYLIDLNKAIQGKQQP